MNAPIPLTLLAEGPEYALLTDADGSGIVLRFKPDRLAAHLTGDDAARFQADYGVIQTQHPDWAPDQKLAQLWDQGGYSWLATSEEN
jgi:hypothetical protein